MSVFWRAALPAVLLTLAFCLLAAFSLPCRVVIDGHGNMGDETMSVALAGRLPLGPLPGYGYRPSGEAWRFSVNTSPFYGWFYGAAVSLAPALSRIQAARAVSRLLGGMSLALLTWCLLLMVLRRGPGRAPLLAQLLLALFVAFVFLNWSRFRFVSSFARVDVLGLFFVAAVLAAGAYLLTNPGRLSAFFFTLLALSSAWTSYIAFYFIGFIAAFVLAALAIEHARNKAPVDAARALLMFVALPVAAALVVFIPLSPMSSGSFAGPAGGYLSVMLKALAPWNRSENQIVALARPERRWFLAASLAGLGVLVVRHVVSYWRQRSGATVSVRVSDLIWTAAAIGGTTLVYVVWLLMLGHLNYRFTYDVLLVTAFAFLQVIVFCFVLRNRPTERYIMAAATMAALLYANVHASRPEGCVQDARLEGQRFWPQAAWSGFYNPFDDRKEPDSRARRQHVESVRDYLVQHHIRRALATDPMFTTMSDSLVTFYFLNDAYAITPSPKAEDELFSWTTTQGVAQIVSTEFGESQSLEDAAGYSALRQCIRRAAASQDPVSCDLGGRRMQVTRVFRSNDVIYSAVTYRYATESSTPISIYSMAAE